MKEIDRSQEWNYEGRRLGYRRYSCEHGKCWATVDLDANEVLAIEAPYDLGDGEIRFTASASCVPRPCDAPVMVVRAAGISYPGDDGTEPPEVRERKAQEYAAAVVESADAAAKAKNPSKSLWNLWGCKL